MCSLIVVHIHTTSRHLWGRVQFTRGRDPSAGVVYNLQFFVVKMKNCLLYTYNNDTNRLFQTYNRSKLDIHYKVKVCYGQEHPSGESSTMECGVNYQLLAVIY